MLNICSSSQTENCIAIYLSCTGLIKVTYQNQHWTAENQTVSIKDKSA